MPNLTTMTFKERNLNAKERVELASLIKNSKVLVYMTGKTIMIGADTTITIKLIAR